MATRRDITKKYARAYQRADKLEKSRLLNGLVETTGWTRDHARRAIRQALARTGAVAQQKRTPRPRKYSYDALLVLQEVWRLSGAPSGKYLAAIMDDTLARLVQFNELGKVQKRVTAEVLDEVYSMSAATIDRYLKPYKDAQLPVALSGTKPSHILRSSIPVRTAMDGTPNDPGFYELDTVAHCGHTLKGEHLWTLTATNPKYGWTMLRTVRNKAYANVHPGLEWVRTHAPTRVTSVDFDNGSEFLNWAVLAWCEKHQLDVTRGRPYQSNDNAHVEQRNGDWVRKHAFRYRYEGDYEMRLLNELWGLVMQRKNHLLPCVKAVGWKHTSAGRKQRVYDAPQTPYARLLAAHVLDERVIQKLAVALRDVVNALDG
ncbi:integrase (plasmid) [Microbacterium sp. HA-8]|uniref:integrase n=1 Tax=Microbacterium sp. HA-8 TaxID=3234200 RepID=UPI0038F7965B